MFFTIYRVLNIRYIHGIHDYSDFLTCITQKYPFISSRLFLTLINLFLMLSFYIMISALSTLFYYQFGIAKILITILIVLICYYIFNQENLHFLLTFNFVLMPFLIFFIMALGFQAIDWSVINCSTSHHLCLSIIYGILYFSYNSLLIIPILFNIKIDNKKNNFILSLSFSFIIFILTLFIDLILLSCFELVKNTDLPIYTICRRQQNLFSFFYFFIILSAILTTLFSSGYSFMKHMKNRKMVLIIFLGTSIMFSFFSFSSLIAIIYPLFGILGLLQIFLILFNTY